MHFYTHLTIFILFNTVSLIFLCIFFNLTFSIISTIFLFTVGTPLMFHDYDRTLALHRHVGLAELQRHRRQFVKTNSNMSHSTLKALGSSFIDSLASNL